MSWRWSRRPGACLLSPDLLFPAVGYPRFYFQPWEYGETDGHATKRTAIWGYFQEPARICRKGTIPIISPHSRPAGGGTLNNEKRNERWGSMSVEERAKTSERFAGVLQDKPVRTGDAPRLCDWLPKLWVHLFLLTPRPIEPHNQDTSRSFWASRVLRKGGN